MLRSKRTAIHSLAASIALGLSLSFSNVGVALGYSHSGAASWADDHYTACGSYHVYLCFNNDCTAFMSEALHSGGGWAFETLGTIPKGNTTDVHKWYEFYQVKVDGYAWSSSFSVANDLPQFLLVNLPGGFPRATMAGTSLAADSGVGTGDVLFYDWDTNNTSDHGSIAVGSGATTDGYFGDYVDSHSNTRHHAFWTLRTWNTSIQTTTIHPWYIDPSN